MALQKILRGQFGAGGGEDRWGSEHCNAPTRWRRLTPIETQAAWSKRIVRYELLI